MKILLITQSYLPILGGLQNIVHQLALSLQQKGYTVKVLTHHYPRHLSSHEIIDGIEVERIFWVKPSWKLLREKQFDVWLYSLIGTPWRIYKMRKLVQEFQPDIIHVHYPYQLSDLALYLHQYISAKLIVTFHGHEFDTSVRQHHKIQKLLQDADMVTAVSQHMLNKIAVYLPENVKTQIIYNGIDIDKFNDSLPYEHHRTYVFTFGRLVAQKGFDLLISAFATVADSFPNIDLFIAGDGEQKQQLQCLVQDFQLSERIRFLGRVNQENLATLIKGCLFVVIPSRNEPFGLVVLETMRMGRRLIATHVGGVPEFLPTDDNQLIAPNQTDLIDSLQVWLSDNQFETHSAINLAQVKKFSIENMTTAYIALYKAN